MVNNLGTPDIQCDAPRYDVVHACRWLGFQFPLDVRWLPMNHCLGGQNPRHSIMRRFWRFCFGHVEAEKHCTCGSPLADVRRYRFSGIFANEPDYLLGQCFKCRTIFWQKIGE